MKDVTKHYSNDDLTIAWKPAKCIHAGECVKALPNVYKPDEKPWIQIENATTEELKNQIKKCPTGALSYTMNNQENNTPEASEVKVDIMKNGPAIVQGTIKVTHSDGSTEIKENRMAICRCGASSNKPFCDGQHGKVGFEG